MPPLVFDAAVRHRNERRLAALGTARSTGPQIPDEPPYVWDAGEVVVEGRPGAWRVHPTYMGLPHGRTALLSPFDRLIHDRVPAALVSSTSSRCTSEGPAPVGLHRRPGLSRRPARRQARCDRRSQAGTLVNAIHEEVHFANEVTTAVRAEIDGRAVWLGFKVTGA